MEFIQSLKTTAQRIIELSSQLSDRAHTWNQEPSAPAGGYADRAGFIVYDDIELFADVYAADDGSEYLLRARLAWSPKDEHQTLFTIITLDFYANSEKVKALIADADNLAQQDIIALLQDADTVPKLIHVSLESGRDAHGNIVGSRYEYSAENLENLTESDRQDFLNTLTQAYNQIVSRV